MKSAASQLATAEFLDAALGRLARPAAAEHAGAGGAGNEEGTGEEGKKRYEKERDRNVKFKSKIDKLEEELRKWRAGQTVAADEQLNLTVDMEESISAASSVANMEGSSWIRGYNFDQCR